MNPRIADILRDPNCPQDCNVDPVPLPDTSAAVVCRDVHFAYHNEHTAVAGVTFSLAAGERACLIGPNGSGKTTLLKMVAGLITPGQGTIHIGGRLLDADFARSVFRYVSFLFQDSQDQVFNSFVSEDVAYGLQFLGLTPAEINERVALALHLVEAQHLAHRPIHHLSGGEIKRVALAGLIAMRSPVLILDEPQVALDPAATEHLLELAEHLHEEHGYAFLTITHEMEHVPRLAERALVMDGGRIIADGSVREILTDVPLLERSRLRPPSITKYFYEKQRRGGTAGPLPITVEEALNNP